MASSVFWRELASQFRSIPDNGLLRAEWTQLDGIGGTSSWTISRDARNRLYSEFMALATRAASELDNPEATDLVDAWLDALRRDGTNFDLQRQFVQTSDGKELRHRMGVIVNLCEASANFCKVLESRAVQSEFEQKKLDDPKNWSPLRGAFEAFKAIKELHATPPERIPESLVRDTIARQLNIRPEDVTDKQIRFEVSGLLPFYPHIELISETKPTDSDPPHDPKALRDSYLSNFPTEKIKIRDLCWAAGQHYREWKRWLAGELKDGSTPDVAFRRVLTSGKRPHELNKKPRPKGWE